MVLSMVKKISLKGKKVGLVLGAGGSHGFAHIGVLRALEEHGVVPDKIVGCSAGALIGAMYASGKSAKEVEDFVRSLKAKRWVSPSLSRSGLLKTEPIVDLVLQFMGVKTFEELSIVFSVNATDINKAKEKEFSSGSLALPLSASFAVPGMFTPVQIDGAVYVDGGASSPLPVHLVPDMDVLIVSDVSFFNRPITTRSSSLSIIKNTVSIMQRRVVEVVLGEIEKKKEEVIVIHPDLSDIYPYDFRKSKQAIVIKRGYNHARKVLGRVLGTRPSKTS